MTGQLSWGQWALEGVVLECGLWTREWGHHSSPRGDTCKHPPQGHPQHPQVSKEAVGEAVVRLQCLTRWAQKWQQLCWNQSCF